MTTNTPDEPTAAPADRTERAGVPEPADSTETVHGSGPAGTDDVVLDRLRAADPAAGETPDLSVIEAAVRERAPEAFADTRTGTGDAGAAAPVVELPVVPDELAARRRRAPLLVAAAVAGVLVVGGGGYALGAGTGAGSASDEQAASTALAPIQLGSSAQEESAAASDAAGGGVQSQLEASRAATDMAYGGSWGGRTVFHQDGLPTEGGRADAWAYDAQAVFSEETARRVADALGVEGEVREEYGAYAVGSSDWTGPQVSLQPDGLASVSFNDPTKDPWGCVVVTPMPAEEGGSTDGGDGTSAVDPGACVEQDHGAPPSGDDAVAQLRAVLGELGLDAGAFEVVADEQPADQGAPRSTTASAYEVVDGRRTGVAWGATFSGAGMSSLYGSLAPRVALGTYDVVSPAAAVERLGDARFSGGGPIAWAREDVGTAVPEIGVAPEEAEVPTVPPTVAEGSRFAWPVTDVTITDARLGAAVQHQPDGAAVLVPAYELTDAGGSTWSVLAVADEQLDFAAAP
ncbi:hypothetical protein [Cellulosimicrobium sp. Marseille-Q4280]|uniref:hypothetical protein n=1 Tax=Cellulosimicrobium sp. Marseille-Q4280 TaxID=2937992 RepID=UPI00203E251F|nr:hypothetical protein [Cellulosimicrobium sp. Marseille-Q4280]